MSANRNGKNGKMDRRLETSLFSLSLFFLSLDIIPRIDRNRARSKGTEENFEKVPSSCFPSFLSANLRYELGHKKKKKRENFTLATLRSFFPSPFFFFSDRPETRLNYFS